MNLPEVPQNPATKNWLLRALVCLGILLVGWVAYVAVINRIVWNTAHELGHDDPSLSLVSVPLPTLAGTSLNGTRIAHFGISIQSPWSDVERQSDVGHALFTTVSKEGTIMIFDPGHQLDTATTMRGTTTDQYSSMTSLYGERALSSNYELLSTAMRATPDQAKWWATRRANLRVTLLLLEKGSATHRANAIYEIHHGEFRGFQLGNPREAPYRVFLELFDSRDRRFMIEVGGRSKDSPSFTQEQVNAMVASIEISPEHLERQTQFP